VCALRVLEGDRHNFPGGGTVEGVCGDEVVLCFAGKMSQSPVCA
jgi:hypothetical protein